MDFKRNAGILLHVTSLPSPHGVGTLGTTAYEFIDWMEKAGLSIWQVLPLVPTNYGDSPYQSVSSTALNYYLIDFDILHKKGLLKKKDYETRRFGDYAGKVNYSLLFTEKTKVLRLAFDKFEKKDPEFISFEAKGEYRDFAVFMTIKAMHEYHPWNLWDKKYQSYSKELEEEILTKHKEDYLFWIWTQYEFLDEWNKLHTYAKIKGIEIMGDMPLYVAYDSVEVWKHPELFVLTEDKEPKLVAGCPPDCFTEDGQLWGNPVYDWSYIKKTNYAWWNERIQKAFGLYDILRIDHFRGFAQYYAIPYGLPNARIGEWMDGPKFDLFKDKLDYRIVAEDLGFIDDDVRTLLKQTKYPGMKILEFAFDGSKDNEHKPSNYKENYIVYTGTHDNMPLYQYILDLGPNALDTFLIDLKEECNKLKVEMNQGSYEAVTETVVELAFASIANTCIIPVQDMLALDGSSRMNLPATVSTSNWSYRVLKNQLCDKLATRIKNYIVKYNRTR
ncbi:MAG: 4-alpha-glucanotransferase [Anaeroplasmataceae bacterium]|nr:4-alpha-glucanotransferase [Anaeroplasmataceae bacterium]